MENELIEIRGLSKIYKTKNSNNDSVSVHALNNLDCNHLQRGQCWYNWQERFRQKHFAWLVKWFNQTQHR